MFLLQKQWRSLLVLGASSCFFLLTRLQSRLPQFSTADNPTAREAKLLTRLLTFVYLPVLNFLMVLVPNALSFDWGMDAVPRITSLSDTRNIITVFFYLTFGLLSKRCVFAINRVTKKLDGSDKLCHCTVCHSSLAEASHSLSCRNTNNNNTASNCVCLMSVKSAKKVPNPSHVTLLSLAFLAFPFLPATNLFFYVGFVVAERVLYLPSAGLCLLMGLGGAAVYRKYRTAFTLGFIVVLLAFSAKTLMRNKDWTNEEALYKSAIPINPPKGEFNDKVLIR